MAPNTKCSPVPTSFVQRKINDVIKARKEKMSKGSFINKRRQQVKDFKYRNSLKKFRESTKHLTSPLSYGFRMDSKVYPSDYIDKSLITECPRSPGIYYTPHSPSWEEYNAELTNPGKCPKYRRSNYLNAYSVKIDKIFAQCNSDGSYSYTNCTIKY